LETALTQIPDGLGNPVVYWLTGFNERIAPENELEAVAAAIAASHRDLVNLYGGFFSISSM
jgi:hypothetical protein